MKILKGHWQLLALTAAVFLFWGTPVILPLKILVVFLHEVAHGLAALLTGGRIESITVSLQQGGLTATRGGNAFVITSAGYLGSLLIGAGLFVVALRSRSDRLVMALLGGAMLVISLLYIREPFALAFGLGGGALMLAAARFLSGEINDMALRVIGLTSMIYVPYDIFDDTIARSGMDSDARALAEMTHLPTLFWGGLWLLASLVMIGYSLRRGLGTRGSNIRF